MSPTSYQTAPPRIWMIPTVSVSVNSAAATENTANRPTYSFGTVVAYPMTIAAEDNQILFAVRTGLASSDHVVDLELIAPATVLTAPSVALENAILERAVRGIIQA